jgi:hypothetical protein
LAVKPAVDDFGVAYTPKQLAAETTRAKRDWQWTTAPDESGIALTYAGQIVRRPDDSPFVLTWDQLAAIAHDRSSAPRQTGLLGAQAWGEDMREQLREEVERQ